MASRRVLLLSRITQLQINAGLRRFLSTSSSSPSPASTDKAKRGLSFVRGAALAVVGVTIPLVGVSIYVREWRQDQLKTLLEASTDKSKPGYLWYPVDDLAINLKRMGLMGRAVEGAKSVKEELGVIRQWHQDRGFVGGLVLRDLEQPLFGEEHLEDIVGDPMRRARRECYYLYYERTPSAEIKQQIFCRGTTLAIDILTCLQAWYVYDEELDARLHIGFRNHADRLIQDVVPMLVKDKRATIQVNGHSLGEESNKLNHIVSVPMLQALR